MTLFGRVKLTMLLLSTLIVAYGLIGGMMNRVSAVSDVYEDLSVFTEVLSRVQNEYVENPDMEKALKGALHGMMEALDPYSSYVDDETLRELSEREDDSASPGLVLSKRYGYAYVVAVLPGSSGEQAGLRTGDMAESIDGEVTTQMSIWEVQKRLLGPPDSKVKLRVVRSRGSGPQEIELKRTVLRYPTVSARIVEDNIGLVRIPNFFEGTRENVRSKVRTLVSSGVKGILIDIRDTTFGEFSEAIETSDDFLELDAKIGEVEHRSGEIERFVSRSEALVGATPVTLLVNGGTSGAAEIFAAVLKGNGVAELVGQRTNGHGSIQERHELRDGGVLFLSTQLFRGPDGEAFQKKSLRDSGLVPDLRSPSPDFATRFYYENVAEESEGGLDDRFYRALDRAIEEEQLKVGIEQLRKRIADLGNGSGLKKAA